MTDTLKSIKEFFGFMLPYMGVIIVVFVGGTMIWSTIYAGTILEYQGTVQTVTQSSFLAPHTEVVLRTYSEDTVHFTLYGYHDFDIGAQYWIRMTMKPYVYGLVCWGKIMHPINIERLETEA